MLHIFGDVKVGDKMYDVEFDAVGIRVGNDGIGAYEYCGARGFDRGHDFVEDFCVEKLKIFDHETGDPDPDADRADVERAIMQNDAICEDINDKWFAERAERDCDDWRDER